MNKTFEKEFYKTRDDILEEIIGNKDNWNSFIHYWARILDSYSIDNILNLYSYNKSGSCYHTFDEWNSEEIGRKIKPKSKGIPICINNYKEYVFDIGQTYGKEYIIRNYNHISDKELEYYYSNKYNIKYDDDLDKDRVNYIIFNNVVSEHISNNYNNLTDDEREFTINAVTSLFLSKARYNLYSFDESYDLINKLDTEQLLKCMQVANKETMNIYNEFRENANTLSRVRKFMIDNVLNKTDNYDIELEKEFVSQRIGISIGVLDKIHNYYSKRYGITNTDGIKNYVEDKDERENKKNESVIYTNEQMSLFTPREEELANKICDIFNSFDTKYQNTFSVSNVELQKWEHINSKKRNLTIILKSSLIGDYGDKENSFTYFNSDKTDEKKINECLLNNAFIQSLYKDKDFSISLSPDNIFIFWNNFDDKNFDMSIPSTKLINQENLQEQELEKIDSEIENSIKDDNISYTVTTAELLPNLDGIKTNVISKVNYNDDGKEVEDKYPKIDYHISDDKIDTSFSAKKRFEDNVNAIELIRKLDKENRNATSEEQDVLAKYVGFGGLSDVFDDNKESWRSENKRLKELLTDEEYKSALHSTLSSFYTPNMAIDSIYKVLDRFGFVKGNILEPSCGVGNFFGRIPSKFSDSKLYGIEIDSISGKIAQRLYPSAKIEINAYENSNISDDLFDVAIGNVPFGKNIVFDRRYKEKNLIHDYFFQKTLDKVRNGGIIAFITTDGTLDKKDTKVRKYIAERAEFLGAIRLPNNTFIDNANTKVTSDIIFLKKRNEIKKDISEESWIYTGEYDDGVIINNYYIENPDMMLGKMELRSTQFGMDNTLNPIDEDINILMERAINKLPKDIYTNMNTILEDNVSNDDILDADDTVKNNAFTIINKDGKDIIYKRSFSCLVPYHIQDGMIAKRIIGLCKIKNALRDVFDIELNEGTDEELKLAQEKLNIEYDNFVKKYGYINESANARAFEEDPDYYLLTSLENKVSRDEEDDKPVYEKGDVFTKRTIRKNKEVTNVENVEDALKCSLNIRGFVDLEYMKTLYPKDKQEIIEELGNLIFQDPEKINDFNEGYVIANEYLSGNVKQKLKYAKSVNIDNKYDKNVLALEQVQPIPLEYDEISVKLGSTWIPEDVYHKFCCELLDISTFSASKLKIKYVPQTNLWLFQAQGLYGYGVKNTNTWGTQRADALSLIKNALNLQSVTVYDTLDDDRKVVNAVETANAREKQELIKQEFKEWIWKDKDRRDRLVNIYNEKFNCMREREFDGSHLTFDGMNTNIELRKHQRDAIARALYGGNTLLAHAVGAGKTYECIASAMEQKRLGIVNKPMFVVPNHLLGQWANEILKLYPMAKVLVATGKDLEKTKRKKLMSRIATGDWDAVLIAHSSFRLIPVSKEYEQKYLENQIQDVITVIERIKEEENETLSVKKIEQIKSNLEARLKYLLDKPRDDTVTFEELGVDELIVDEAHMFKNLSIYSKMRNIAGVGGSQSKKATDLFMKLNYIYENNNGKGAIFATGTPISNSMSELYVMQKYLQQDRLKEMGLDNFDDWASTFGEMVNSFEITPDGSGFRTKSRFSKFFNIPELMSIFKEIADIKTSKMINLPIPKLKGGDYKTIVAPKTDELAEFIKTLAERSEHIRNGCDPSEDNMLLVTNDGRKGALDLRLIDSSNPDLSCSKINMAVDNIYKIWLENQEDKLTQLVFCDLSTPKNDGSFNVYDDIKTKLINKGVPEEEIEFIHNAKTNEQKLRLFEDMRSGTKRILIGSTSKMGAGMNVQDKLIALHHLDCPWRPSDIEQREGRILRQGNQNAEVEIYRYVTEGSFDAYSYQLIQTKATFINQIMANSNAGGRIAEDLDRDVLTYAEVKAIASGNPLILEKYKVENELKELYLSKSRYNKSHIELDYKYNSEIPNKLQNLNKYLHNLEEDVCKVKDLSADNFMIMIKDKIYDSRKDASTKLYECLSLLKKENEIKIGEISGFDIVGTRDDLVYEPIIYIKGEGKYKVEINNYDEIGNIYKLENMLKSFEKKIETTKSQISFNEKQLNDIKEELSKPFQYQDRIKDLESQRAKIDSELDLDKQDNINIIEDELENKDEMER